MVVEWLGGPYDGSFITIKDGSKSVVIFNKVCLEDGGVSETKIVCLVKNKKIIYREHTKERDR